MTYRKNHNPQRMLWLVSAMAAPLIQAAGQCTWPVVLVIGLLCFLCTWFLGGVLAEPGPWLRLIQSLWLSVIVSELLHWSAAVWPGHDNPWAAPVIILILSCWLTMGKGSETPRAGCVLLWPVALLMGIVLLSGMSDIKGENLVPFWEWQNYHLITLFLIFPLCAGSSKRRLGKPVLAALIVAAITSAITAGVLSYSVAAKQPSPVYELSRSVSLFGITERVESLTAAAMTMGYFCAISYLLEYTKGSGMGGRTWVYAGLSVVLYLLEIRLRSIVIAIGTVVLWIIFPMFTGKKHKS